MSCTRKKGAPVIKNLIKSVVERFPALTLFYRNSRDLLDQRHPPRKTPWGFTFSGHDAMAEGSFEPEATKVARGLMADVDVLVNIGANVGYYCCHALTMGKPVIAVEPNTRNLHYLLKNIQSNGWSTQAEIYPVAMGTGSDILQMYGGGTGASLIKGWAAIPESYVTQVPTLSLDRVLGASLCGRKALILVDIEGAEYMMLQGAVETLRSDPSPIWMMEISVIEHQPEGTKINPHLKDTFEMFFECGYRAFAADASMAEISQEAVARASQGDGQLGTQNFVFRHM